MNRKKAVICGLLVVLSAGAYFCGDYLANDRAKQYEVQLHAKKAELKQLQDEITARNVPEGERIGFVNHAEEITKHTKTVLDYQNDIVGKIGTGKYENKSVSDLFEPNEPKANLPWFYTKEHITWKVNEPVQIDGVNSENKVVFYCVNDMDEIYAYVTASYDVTRGVFTKLGPHITSLGSHHMLAD